MKVVIEISDKLYDTIKSDVVLTREESIALAMCVYRGKVAGNPETDDVLDKIRAEIMSKDGLEEALEIIDRYKAESEWQE